MSFTNSTTNYGLPQYISTDIPSYLVDQNGAWATIDSALKSASDNATQAINDASTADGKAVTAQTDASSALTKANGALSNIADTFDSTSTYSVGDRVIYNSILYVCSTAVTIPGAFDPVNWTRETIEEEIDNINSDIATINSNLTDIGSAELLAGTDNTSASHTETVQSLSQYRFIMICAGTPQGAIYNPAIYPVNDFKSNRNSSNTRIVVNAVFSGTEQNASCYYVNDTTIGLYTTNTYARVYGIK